jgi:uncharacterized protein (TIGR00730 family)
MNTSDPLNNPLKNINISDSEASFKVIQEAVLQLWDVVNGLTSIQPPKCEHYRVTIFGSARISPGTNLYEDVKHLAMALTEMECDIVTGGGPGLMAAANEGSVIADPQNRFQSIGIRINLDFEQETNPFVEQLFRHRTFFSRLHHFVLLSNAFVVMPGGIGTTLETLMIWQLLQVRQLHNTPLILVGKMWADLVAWANENMINTEYQLAQPIDIKIPHCVDNIDQAIALLKELQKQWKCPI